MVLKVTKADPLVIVGKKKLMDLKAAGADLSVIIVKI